MTTISDLLASTERARRDAARRRKDASDHAHDILNQATASGRSNLTEAEDRRFEALLDQRRAADDEIGALDQKLSAVRDVAAEEAVREATQRISRSTGVRRTFSDVRADRHPLAYTPQALDSLQAAIDTRTAGRFEATMQEQRAALLTSTFGAPRVWGSNVLDGPRLLSAVAGVPTQPSDAALAQFPVLTLPSAGASVAETVSLAEFAASTAGSVTLARYGRYTDMSKESMLGTDAGAIVSMHQIGIAKDLDSALIGLVNTAAGGAVAFTADVPAAIRKAMAGVVDATAAADVSDITVLVNPADAALLQSVTPTGGQTIAEAFQNFSGALVYPSSAVPTGFALVANLKSGARYFEAQGVATASDVAIKTGVFSVATSVISGYGLGLAGGAFAKIDIVSP